MSCGSPSCGSPGDNSMGNPDKRSPSSNLNALGRVDGSPNKRGRDSTPFNLNAVGRVGSPIVGGNEYVDVYVRSLYYSDPRNERAFAHYKALVICQEGGHVLTLHSARDVAERSHIQVGQWYRLSNVSVPKSDPQYEAGTIPRRIDVNKQSVIRHLPNVPHPPMKFTRYFSESLAFLRAEPSLSKGPSNPGGKPLPRCVNNVFVFSVESMDGPITDVDNESCNVRGVDQKIDHGEQGVELKFWPNDHRSKLIEVFNKHTEDENGPWVVVLAFPQIDNKNTVACPKHGFLHIMHPDCPYTGMYWDAVGAPCHAHFLERQELRAVVRTVPAVISCPNPMQQVVHLACPGCNGTLMVVVEDEEGNVQGHRCQGRPDCKTRNVDGGVMTALVKARIELTLMEDGAGAAHEVYALDEVVRDLLRHVGVGNEDTTIPDLMAMDQDDIAAHLAGMNMKGVADLKGTRIMRWDSN